MPLLKPALTIVIVITVIGSLKVFDIIYMMTWGGPGEATHVLAFLMYKEAFTYFHMGRGSAIAAVLFGMIMILSALYIKKIGGRE